MTAHPSARRGARRPPSPAAVALGALAIHRTTLLPGVDAWDTAEAQAVLPLLGTMHPTGFPAYVLLGWLASVVLAPLGEPAFRVNLLSAVLVAGAAGTTVPLLRRLDVPLPLAVAAAAGLALTPVARAPGGGSRLVAGAFGHPVGRARLAARTSLALAVAVALLMPTGLGFETRWRAVDRSGDTAMEQWLDEAMATLDRDAVVISWWSYSTTLWYGTLVRGLRPDVLVVDDSDLVFERLGEACTVIDAHLGTRLVYVIRATAADLAALALRYDLEPVGRPTGVYRVTGPRETEP